jgi:hypothetical protein
LRYPEDSVVENCCFILSCGEEGGGGLRTRTRIHVNNCFFDGCKVKKNSSKNYHGGAIKIHTDEKYFFNI